MSGVHRGRRGLRWRLVVAVMAAAVGRGYRGRHRLEEVAPGRAPATAELGAPLPLHVPGAQLAVVPVPTSPDPLVDTMPHPVVRLFPLPVLDHDGEVVAPAPRPGQHEAEALADVDAAREAAALAALIDPTAGDESYHGRHTA